MIPLSAMKRVIFVAAVLTLWTGPARAATCESLTSLALPKTRIAEVETVAAGAFRPPSSPARGGGAGSSAQARGSANPFGDLPAFCRIRLVVDTSADSAIRIDVWMPAAGWNEKFLVTGYAFFGNTLNPAALAGPLRSG